MSHALTFGHDGRIPMAYTTDGTHAWNGGASNAANVLSTGSVLLDGLLWGTKWAGAITYSAPNALNDYPAGYFSGMNTSDFSAFTTQQMKVFHFALDANTFTQPSGFSVEGFTNLGVTFIGGGSGAGTIRGANMDDANDTAYAFYPNRNVYGGDTFFGDFYDTALGGAFSLKTPKAGNYAWHTMIHELGHSLGLKHGHETLGPGNVALPSNVDSVEFSVMTYRSYIGDDANGYNYGTWDAPQTFMVLDIAALQHLYGADFTTNATNTTYKWSSANGDTLVNGQVAIDAGGLKIFATIWDGGGIDTYDLSAYTTALKINLAPGAFSVFSPAQLANLGGGPNGGFARGNIWNAKQFGADLRSLIENAIGGSNNDTIIGNAVNNKLTGNAGNDVLNGGAGVDILIGGAGNDTLIGSTGRDTMTGGFNNDTFTISAASHSGLGAAADIIMDFGDSGVDKINLAGVIPGTLIYRDTLAFSGLNQVRVRASGADVLVEVNVAGSLAADFAILLKTTSLASMDGTDFVL